MLLSRGWLATLGWAVHARLPAMHCQVLSWDRPPIWPEIGTHILHQSNDEVMR